MESVGNVSLELYFHSGKQPCEFPDMLRCPLVSCRSRWCAGKGELVSCSVEPSGGVCWALLHSPGSSHHRPGMGWDGRDTAARGCTKAHLCEPPAQTSLGSLGVGLGVGQEGQQKPLS